MFIKTIISVLLFFCNILLPVEDNSKKDFLEELIEEHGHSVQKHLVWTEDDYQISLHRIVNAGKTKNSVLLVHGLLSCGAQWVVNKEKSLAFMLANAGYDVWILNSRGTSLSKGHRTFSVNSPEYWDFSFHELGYYDAPAAIDHILNITKKDSLHFVGHSQGSSSVLVTAITRPEYQRKIISGYLLHPAAFIHNVYEVPNAMIHSVTELLQDKKQPQLILRNTVFSLSFNWFCSIPLIGIGCTYILMNVFGGNSHQAEDPQTLLNIYTKYVFNDASRKQLEHLIQLIEARKFQMFDYGPEINRRTYNGSEVPPEYDLSAVNFPLSVEYGTIDGLTAEPDSLTLISKLKTAKNNIPLLWNHLDACHSKIAHTVLHLPIINSFNQYVNKI